MKRYLAEIRSGRGAIVHIAYYSDTPNKNYRIYLNGTDIGKRYEKIGNASRYLKTLSQRWISAGETTVAYWYNSPQQIPRRGSNA